VTHVVAVVLVAAVMMRVRRRRRSCLGWQEGRVLVQVQPSWGGHYSRRSRRCCYTGGEQLVLTDICKLPPAYKVSCCSLYCMQAQ
jgi:hypothetical protein